MFVNVCRSHQCPSIIAFLRVVRESVCYDLVAASSDIVPLQQHLGQGRAGVGESLHQSGTCWGAGPESSVVEVFCRFPELMPGLLRE